MSSLGTAVTPPVYSEITNKELKMYRQVHPRWIVNSRLTSQAFNPTKKDENQLSVSSSDKTTAQDAYEHHTVKLGLQSDGTWAVTIDEIVQIEMKCFESPVATEPADPSHSHIDFNGLSNNQKNVKADKLAHFARTRGLLHPAG